MYGYIYLLTNIKNNKKYIGQHKSNKIDYNYFGSGNLIKEAINQFGKENFIISILEICDSIDKLNDAEIKWIKYYNAVEDDNFYNISPGGYGKACIAWNKGKHQPLHPNSAKGLEYGRHLPASDKLKQILSNYRKTVVVSDITKKRLSENASGRIYVNKDGIIKRPKLEELDLYLQLGYKIGKK